MSECCTEYKFGSCTLEECIPFSDGHMDVAYETLWYGVFNMNKGYGRTMDLGLTSNFLNDVAL